MKINTTEKLQVINDKNKNIKFIKKNDKLKNKIIK